MEDRRGNLPLLILGISAGLLLSFWTIRAVVWKNGTLIDHSAPFDAGSR